MTDKISQSTYRKIIDDFAEEIKTKKVRGAKPSTDVIYFRNWVKQNHEEPIYEIPTEILRFRKNNGRIASDVSSYEEEIGPLDESIDETQNILRNFLEKKDPEKTNELIKSIQHSGQRNAAIITSDGFLINGNRRKMALEKLYEETSDEKFKWMKVVILPGKGDNGGPPTSKEIEQIENRYQLQSEGKSEYYNFDKAISMRLKIQKGFSLEEQLRDDSSYYSLSPKEFDKIVRKITKEYLEPLECVDRYLDDLNRPGYYTTVSTGISDKEGRWQSFIDYSNLRNKLENENQRIGMNVEEEEIGDVEEIAFKLIRKRTIKDLPKVHQIIRSLPKWLKVEEAKNELFELLEIDIDLSEEDCIDANGIEIDERKKDRVWGGKNEEAITRQVKKAKQLYEHDKDCEDSLTLLEGAKKKLTHDNMQPMAVRDSEYQTGMKLAAEIKKLADDLETEFYNLIKGK